MKIFFFPPTAEGALILLFLENSEGALIGAGALNGTNTDSNPYGPFTAAD